MKHSFTIQANEVKRLQKLVLNVDQEVLREAEVTLRVLASIGEKRILILEDLIKLAQEFIADTPVDRVEVIQYQQDFRKLLNKIK
jgi:hypothetical protein